MSDIGAPPNTIGKHQYGADPYGYGTGQAGGAQDPWAAYGLGAGGPGGGEAIQTPEMQAYVQQLYYYHQMYNQMLYSATDPNQISQLRQYDAQVLQYLQQVGAPPPQEGQPFGGMGPEALGPGQQPSQYTNTPPDYQTKDAVVFEEGASSNATIDRQDPDKREANYYQPSNVCNIPSNAANVKVTLQPDDGITGDQMAVVEISFKNPDGSTETRVVKYHGVNREGFQLALNTPSEEQVDLSGIPEDLQNKIQWGQSAGPQELKGDPPTDMDGDTRIYDGQSFEISPVPTGKDEETKVLANGNVTITPNSNNEYYEVSHTDGPPPEYTVTVYNSLEDKEAGNVKETIHIDGDLVDKINFACDPSRIEFKDDLADPADPDGHSINPNNDAADKLALGGAAGGWEEGQPINPDSPADSAPSRVDGDTAIYEDDANVELTNYFDGTVTNYEITASGTVTFHPDKQSDEFEVKKDGDWYVITVTGKDQNGNEKTITYKVKADQVDQINIADVDPAQVDLSALSAEDKAKVQVGGEAQGTTVDADAMVSGLLGATTRSEGQLLTALNSAGYSYTSIEEFRTAIASGQFPPNPVDAKLLNFFRILDPTLGSLLSHQTIDASAQESTESGSNARIVALLQVVYPNSIVNAGENSGANLGFSIDGTAHTWGWSWQDGHNEISLE